MVALVFHHTILSTQMSSFFHVKIIFTIFFKKPFTLNTKEASDYFCFKQIPPNLSLALNRVGNSDWFFAACLHMQLRSLNYWPISTSRF